MGSWLTYGLGRMNQNLPGFVVLPDFRRSPFSGSQQWGRGFLPASYQGTMLRWQGRGDSGLQAAGGSDCGGSGQEMKLLRAYNQSSWRSISGIRNCRRRIDAYELAYRMQAEVPKTLDLDVERADHARCMVSIRKPPSLSALAA